MTKLKFIRPKSFDVEIHRAGWNWVIKHLFDKYHDDNAEVLVDDFIERTFDWDYKANRHKELPHYTNPWIGFIHNPVTVTKPFDLKASAFNICSRIPFLKALRNCKGLYTLSNDLAVSINYLLDQIGAYDISVEVLKHPTIQDVELFDINKFMLSPKVTNIGYWLRNFDSFFTLDTTIPKHILLGKLDYAHQNYTTQYREFKYKTKLTGEKIIGRVTPHQALTNDEYDKFLTGSISYINLIDTSANNAVIECIVRNIPLLVNYHPAVVEYLGEDYPFYYITQAGANKKINDMKLIKETHEYLCNMDKRFLSIESFIHEFEYSDLYNNL
tara:strand:+ start:1575 stop:2558 length:984 start_codon:yes stop_codon:yes gene_type:complete